MREQKTMVSVRISPKLAFALRKKASDEGVSYSTIVEQAIERELYPSEKADGQLELLRSVLMIRELLLDMSPREVSEKEQLFKAMDAQAQTLLRGIG